jgi:flagellar motility protein MotE (MotC chaperone)
VCEFVLGYTNSKKRVVQLAAIESLGTLGDPHALAALQKFALARRQSPEQLAASRAIQAIENFRKSTEGLADVRTELLDLQKENRELHKNFDALEKKFNAVETKPDITKKAAPVLKSPRQKS